MFTNPQRIWRWTPIAVAIGLLCSSQALAKKPPSKSYTVVLLPDVNGNTELDGHASAMNELVIDGQLAAVEVVGTLEVISTPYSPGHAYHWWLDSEGNVVTKTPLPPTDQLTEARDVNDDGIIVGGGEIDGDMLPLVWLSPGEDPIPLPVPAGITGFASNINSNGMVVGVLQDAASGMQMLVVWQLTEGPTFVGPFTLDEAEYSLHGTDLNDAGQVVAAVSYQGKRWSVSWDDAQPIVLGPEILTGEMLDENGQLQTVNLRCEAINEAGDVCGDYAAAEGPHGAFLLLADGTLFDLPPLESKRYITRSAGAWDLNDAVDPASIQLIGTTTFFDKRGWVIGGYQTVWQGDNVTDLEAETETDLRLRGIDRISDHGWLAGHAGYIIDHHPSEPPVWCHPAAVVVPK